jgi:dihydrolipoamide dehydrogenase
MKEYDVIVIGSGCGMLVANAALSYNAKVAVVDKGPRLGGTCLNYGCIPSKMLIYPADRIMEIRESRELGIKTKIEDVDFKSIMDRMRSSRHHEEKEVRKGITNLEGLDFYEAEGHFIDDYTIEVGGDKIKGDRIFVASGSRPFIPPIKGLDTVDFLTNESVLELKEKPESIVIIGGGYIGVEYAHFFEAMGTKVAVVEMADRLVLSEEPEIADLLLKSLKKRMTIALNSKVTEVKGQKSGIKVVAEDKDRATNEYSAQSVMVAIGRMPNSDLLKPENTGVETDKKDFIKVNEYFETSKKNIFAVGDANGEQMFTHTANREAALAIENVLHADHGEKTTLDRNSVPHAVYSYPPIASVGMMEEAARKDHKVLAGSTRYFSTAKGEAMQEQEGFAKAIVDRESYKILGFHIIGPHAPMLIQEVVNAMTSGGHADEINKGIHIHPSLSELVPLTTNMLEAFE